MANSDPILWSVDQVVSQTCSRDCDLYSTLSIKPILDFITLENAFRANDIDGETLLAIEDANVKDDLGISSFGQRREVRKIILHLRGLSETYESPRETPKRRLELDHTSEDRTSVQIESPLNERHNKKRRVRPETLSTEPLTRPEDFNSDNLEEHWKVFLQRHQEVPNEEIFRPYEESESEKELESDDSLIDDLNSEHNEPKPHLVQDEIDRVIDEAIQKYKILWTSHKQVKKHKSAFRRWMQAAEAGTRKPQQDALQRELAQFEKRLAKFRASVADTTMEYRKVEEVERNCLNLQATVEDISERHYYLDVLASNNPPEPPVESSMQTLPAEILSEDEEILESSDDDTVYEGKLLDTVEDMIMTSEDDISLELSYDPVDDDWNPRVPAKTKSQVNKDRMPSPEMDHQITEQSTLTATSQEVDDVRMSPVSDVSRDLSRSSPLFSNASILPSAGTDAFKPPKDYPIDYIEEDSDFDHVQLPQSRYQHQGTTVDSAITLGSSPSRSEHSFHTNFSIRTPPLNPEIPPKVTFRSKRPQKLQYPPITETRLKKWHQIRKDPFMALCKIVYRHTREHADEILEYVLGMNLSEMQDSLRACIGEIQDTEEDDIPEAVEAQPPILWTFYFIVYACGKGFPDVWKVSEKYLDHAYEMTYAKASEFDKVLRPLLRHYIATDTKSEAANITTGLSSGQSQSPDLGKRTTEPSRLSTPSFVSHSFDTRTPTPEKTASDVEMDAETGTASVKKRKRYVEQSQEALARQKDDQSRVSTLEERRKILMARFQAQDLPSVGETRVVPINTQDPVIYLDPHISGRVKQHQITGIQFLWRELIEDPKQEGCLLAHTMGLGKTMQVISFLVTLAQANISNDQKVRDQIPESLRSKKVLILCPASLVENWYDEILMWTPSDDIELLGGIYKVSGLRNPKLRIINEWDANPGILLCSYETFRSLLTKSRCTTQEDVEHFEKSLLRDPCIVVADEAHKLKNVKSRINKVAQQFQTKSRIALTGSPLNNHLEEYHTMIDWIAPKYLGTLIQFKAKYSEPIERGLYSDSTRYEKRKSLEKLYILKRDLAPKIDRKDISVIASDMPQKTEFFITVPLTAVQKDLYTLMVKHILSGVGGVNGGPPRSSNAQLWSWLAMLSWLCNHPSCLIRKIQEKDTEGFQNAIENMDNIESTEEEFEVMPAIVESTEEEIEVLPANIDLCNSPITSLLPKFLEIFKAAGMIDNMKHPSLSTRADISQSLINESVARGEKLLLFSHSIPTLDYLQVMLDDMGCKYLRIDGSTRAEHRQSATKYFNEAENDYMVFLISTRAGGLGLNLQGANRVIIYDFGFNPSWEQQAIGRAYRLGQKKPVFVYRFRAGGTFEEAMYNKSVFKTQLFSRVVDQKNFVRQASKRIEDYLFTPTDVDKQDLSQCLGKDSLLDKIVELMPDAIRNLVLTETFQREDEEDEMTAEEKKTAEEQVELERLYRLNPALYMQKMEQRKTREDQSRLAERAAQPTNLNLSTPVRSFESTWNAGLSVGAAEEDKRTLLEQSSADIDMGFALNE